MKILVYCGGNLDLNRGTPNRERNIINYLSKKEKVTLAASKLTSTEIRSRVDFYQLKRFHYPKGINFLLKVKEIKKIIEGTQPDIIYGFTYTSTFILGTIARLLKIPVVIEMHGPGFKDMKENLGFSSYWLSRLEGIALKDLAGITTVSSKLRSYYLNFLKNEDLPVEVVHGGVDFNLFSPHVFPSEELKKIKNEKDFFVGYIGNFRDYQGIGFLIEAAKKIKDPDCKFIIVGGETEKEREQLRIKLKGNNLQSRFVVFETKEYKDIPSYLKAIDVLVSPRPSLPITEYSFPSKLPEYMALGKPIISTNVGGAGEIIKNRENGILIPSENIVENLVEAIFLLKENRGLRKKIGENAYLYTRNNLDWNKLTDQLTRLFKKILFAYEK